nr:O-antigen ligase family protein [Methylonatrum kenyense]
MTQVVREGFSNVRRFYWDRNLLTWLVAIFASGFIVFSSSRLHRDVLYFAVFLPFLVFSTREQWRLILQNTGIRLLAALFLFLLLSLAWGPGEDQIDPFDRFRWAVLSLIYFSVVLVAASEDSRVLVKLGLVLSIAACAAVLWSSFQFYGTANGLQGRVYNHLFYSDNPIRGSVGLAFAGALAGLLLFTEKSLSPWMKALFGATFVFVVLFLFLGQSRGLLLALGAAMGVAFIVHGRLKWIALGAIAVGIALIASELLFGPGRSFIERGATYRLDIWQAALLPGLEAPFFGHGLSVEREIFVESVGKTFYSPHNLFLVAFLLGGLVALALLVLLVVFAVSRAYRHRRDWEYRVVLGLIAFGVINVSLTGHEIIYRVEPHVWVSFFLPLALAYSGQTSLRR